MFVTIRTTKQYWKSFEKLTIENILLRMSTVQSLLRMSTVQTIWHGNRTRGICLLVSSLQN